ncbi:MAG TPA: hypothetical protein VGH61_03955 [Steroidobacteraceae bacterium]
MSSEAQELRPVAHAAVPQTLEATAAPAARLAALAPQAVAPVSVPAVTALTRVQAAAGQVIPQLQYQVTRLGVAGQVGLAALTAAVAIAVGALLPAWHAMQGLSANLSQAQHAPSGYSIEQAVPRLMASLPTRAQIPAVLGEVYAQAKAAGVPLDTGRYVFSPPKSGSVASYDLEFPVKGAAYPAVRSFINHTLAAVPAASLTKLQIERKAVGEQSVNADIGFVVFVRSEAGQ